MKKLLTVIFCLIVFVGYSQDPLKKNVIEIKTNFIWQGDTIRKDSLAYFELKPDSMRGKYISGSFTNWFYTGKVNLSSYRKLSDHDSLSTLQEKNYSSLDGKPDLSIYRTLSNHDSLSTLQEKSYNSLDNLPDLSVYRLLTNHDSLSTLQEKSYNSLNDKPDLSVYRKLNNHDSLSTLQERNYSSLIGIPNLSIYRTLNNHDSLSTLQEKSYNSLTERPDLTTYRTLSNHDSLSTLQEKSYNSLDNLPDLNLKANVDNPTFTTKITTPEIKITNGAAANTLFTGDASGNGSWTAKSEIDLSTLNNDLNYGANKITYVSALTFNNDRDIVDKAYVDAVASGNLPKLPVDVATTGNITLSGTQTIDTYSAIVGSRVLVWKQTSPIENGVYIVGSGAWTRATDLDSWAELHKAYVAVLNGSQAGSSFVCTIISSGTLETNDVTWVLYNVPTNIVAGTGLTKTGNSIALNVGSASALGGVKQGSGTTIAVDGTISVSTDFAPSSGSTNYIQASPASPQSDDIWINGTALIGGNVGIGTLTPTIPSANIYGLSVNSTMADNSGQFIMQNNGTPWARFGVLSGYAMFQDFGSSNGMMFDEQSNLPMFFRTNGIERMKINSDGSIRLNNLASATTNIVTVNSAGQLFNNSTFFLDKFKTGSMGTSGQIPVANGTSSDFTWTSKSAINLSSFNNDLTIPTTEYIDNKVSDTAYDATAWNGITTIAPSKNAVRDKLVTMDAAIALNTAKVSNVNTDLTYTASPTNGIVVSSDGTDATLPIVNGTNAGLMTPSQYNNLSNQSGTNSGDNAVNSLYSGLVSNATHTGDVTGSTALTIGADKVLDSHINWGSGATQVSTTDMPEGTNLYYTEGRVSSNTAVVANTAKVTNATHTGDVTGANALTLATVNSNIGTYNNVTVNAKGLVTAASNVAYVTGTPWTAMGYLTSQTSHADVVVDGDFASQGIMLRGASSGTYSILTNNSTNWNTAYGWGNHAGLYKAIGWFPTWSEISSNPFSFTSPTNGQLIKYNSTTGKFENTSFTEADPTVSAWAKQSTKPTYTYTEVGAEPTLTKGDFTESVDGLQLSATRKVIGGALDLSLSAGREIPTAARLLQHDDAYTYMGMMRIYGSSIYGVLNSTYFQNSYNVISPIISDTPAYGSLLPINSGAVWSALQGKENTLGNPAANAMILSSTTAGVRTWIANTVAAHNIQSHSDVYIPVTLNGAYANQFFHWTGSNWGITAFKTINSTAIFGSGNLSLLPTSGGTLTGHLGGTTATFSGLVTGSNFQLSDFTLKEDIKPIDLKRFSDIKFYSYVMKSDSTNTPRYGVIAQEVEQYAPELVQADSCGIKSVNYTELLIAKVAQQESNISLMQNLIAVLFVLIAALFMFVFFKTRKI